MWKFKSILSFNNWQYPEVRGTEMWNNGSYIATDHECFIIVVSAISDCSLDHQTRTNEFLLRERALNDYFRCSLIMFLEVRKLILLLISIIKSIIKLIQSWTFFIIARGYTFDEWKTRLSLVDDHFRLHFWWWRILADDKGEDSEVNGMVEEWTRNCWDSQAKLKLWDGDGWREKNELEYKMCCVSDGLLNEWIEWMNENDEEI